jgi:ketosteroid isomerase-like protein
MRNIFRFVIFAALVALGWWLWTDLFPGAERVIAGRMAEIARTATFVAKENPIARAAKAQRLVNFFADDAVIVFDAPGMGAQKFTGRDEFRDSALMAFARFNSLKVQFVDVGVIVAAEGQTAIVNCTAKVWLNGNKDYGVQEMRFQFRKTGRSWFIIRAETVKTLS